MQQLTLHKKFYHIKRIDETDYSEKAYEREKKLKNYDKLISEGCSQKTALETLEMSRAAYYRWKKNYKLFGLAGLEDESRQPKKRRKAQWTVEDELSVLKVRKENYKYGKYKITEILFRDYGSHLKASTVGRIISKFIKKGTIKSVGFHMGRHVKKRRVFDAHVKRWIYPMKAQKMGELIQMDHATIKLDCGEIIKHFKAICPITKLTAEKAYSVETTIYYTHLMCNKFYRF